MNAIKKEVEIKDGKIGSTPSKTGKWGSKAEWLNCHYLIKRKKLDECRIELKKLQMIISKAILNNNKYWIG